MHNILITDDEETVRITLFEWFVSALAGEVNVLMAGNGVEAIKALQQSPVSLLVTDLNMPKMDGFELLAHMKNNHPSTPVIVMSAFATPDIKKKVTELGAITFLAKPLNFEDLEEIDFKKLLSGNRGHVNGISLQSFMQLIDMEGKTCTLIIESQGRQAMLYIERGELIDARTGEMSGEEAAYEIMTWSVDEELTIEIENSCPAMTRKIEFSIMHLLMESARLIDERNIQAAEKENTPAPEIRDDPPSAPEAQSPPPAQAKPEPPPEPEPEVITAAEEMKEVEVESAPAPRPRTPTIKTSAASLAEVQQKLKDFSTLDGFNGIALISHSGETMCKVTGNSSLDVEKAAIMVNNVMVQAKKAGSGMGDQDCLFLHLETTGDHALVSCLEKNGDHPDLRLILFLENDDAMGLAKMMLRTTLEEIMAILIG